MTLLKLRSYGAAHRTLGMPSIDHRSHKGSTTGRRTHINRPDSENGMKGFRSAGGTQRFLGAFSLISPHFRPRRHLLTASDYRTEMTERFTAWNAATGVPAQA